MTYEEIVSGYEDELFQIQNTSKANSFRLGDITNELLKIRTDEKASEIYNAVGVFSGKRARTIREYAQISEFFSPAVREVYDILSFDHFRTAMRYGERWQDALEWACDRVVDINRPASVDSMEIHFEDEETNQNLEYYQSDYENTITGVINKLRELVVYVKLDNDVINKINNAIFTLEQTLKEKVK